MELRMPEIYDNIKQPLLTALHNALGLAQRADFCVGYFNLRGWSALDCYIDDWKAEDGQCCRLLIGMQDTPHQEFQDWMSFTPKPEFIDNQMVVRLRKKLAQEFKDQLATGLPTNEAEKGLRRLACQLKSKRLIVKVFLKHRLHAKLYLLHRHDPVNPIMGYMGSSNLTMAGMQHQGELNIDVLDRDATTKLANWFEDRWNHKLCIDISDELIEIIENSWASPKEIPPYHIYIKIAYHLSREARDGISDFRLPPEFQEKLFDYQSAAVKIAAHHLHTRGGVIIGDVVGLGKTLMATALARIFEVDFQLETLIICPKNLVPMWQDYARTYRMQGATVLSISKAGRELPRLPRHRLIILDESHNLRNPKGQTYGVIKDYITRNQCQCILLTATPYNKDYRDLSSQLKLFVPEDKDLGIRPEKLIKEIGELEFNDAFQCSPRSLAGFEKSEFAEDWRQLMRLYMVRRTRSFIQENYACGECEVCKATIPPSQTECSQCKNLTTSKLRRFLTFPNGERSYFPVRIPRTVKFDIDPQYAQLYDTLSVDIINSLSLPRYGLGSYIDKPTMENATPAEQLILQGLFRAGQRLMGFCRTNLFKRLESSGPAFLQSIKSHIIRNMIFFYAIETNQDLPVGTMEIDFNDMENSDEGVDSIQLIDDNILDNNDSDEQDDDDDTAEYGSALLQEAERIYEIYKIRYPKRYKWIRPSLFRSTLAEQIMEDIEKLQLILDRCSHWIPENDQKLAKLEQLISEKHPDNKLLIFTQFADTANYLKEQLRKRGVSGIEAVTGKSHDPTLMAWRFSPVSNGKQELLTAEEEIRVLITTDVLSEGQNLQDCCIVVNYDLPWAIIRLVQRAGRVDRIGQKAEEILCYSFLPADGVNQIINLQGRITARLRANAEVVGADEAYFEGDLRVVLKNLYDEKSGILDGDTDADVDLASMAYQIWKQAITEDPGLEKIIETMAPVVNSTRAIAATAENPEGVLVYLRTSSGNDAMSWIDCNGNSVTESQYSILKAAECKPDTPAIPRSDMHYELVGKGVDLLVHETTTSGGQLGKRHEPRRRVYDRLSAYVREESGSIFVDEVLKDAIQQIYDYPLTETGNTRLRQQLRLGITNDKLADMVTAMYQDDTLCLHTDEAHTLEPRIICSMGLAAVARLPMGNENL